MTYDWTGVLATLQHERIQKNKSTVIAFSRIVHVRFSRSSNEEMSPSAWEGFGKLEDWDASAGEVSSRRSTYGDSLFCASSELRSSIASDTSICADRVSR